MLGKTEGRSRRGQQRTRWLNGIIDSMDMSLTAPGDNEGQGSLGCCSPWGCKESDMTEQLNNNKACYRKQRDKPDEKKENFNKELKSIKKNK